MINKITKIVLCVLAFAGFLIIGINALITFDADNAYDRFAAAGLGMSAGVQKNKLPAMLTQEPYQYIHLPKTSDPPLAITLYNTLPPLTSVPSGQDRPSENDNEPDGLPAGVFPVIPIDMSEKQTAQRLLINNESKYSPDINSLSQSIYPLSYSKPASTNTSSPTVLIIHSHGTECYLQSGDTYTKDTPTHSADTSINVVAVGKAIATVLKENGVETIHCETMFDKQSYSDSYDLSEQTVMEYIKKYPSIQYVFDVHRDSIVRENKEKLKPVTVIDGIPTAQAMFVVGTNTSGADHPNWMDNLTVASIFQRCLIEQYGSIMRPINLRAASFNAEHAPGSILIEVGTCGNTIEEALNCARLLGQTISEIIINDGKTRYTS